MNEQISFGKYIKQLRVSRDLTQSELARRVGCATVTLRRIEYDTLRLSVQMAERLAMALNIPISERADFVRFARKDLAQTPDPLPTPPPTPEEIGKQDLSGRAVRGYQLGEHIGSGGSGAVYRAEQSAVGREVAIKIILPSYANQPEFIRRFEAEAQLVARLEHPHIVPLYDYWREPGSAYLVMRLLRGGSLQEKLAAGPLPPAFVLAVLDQIGIALHAAHRFGVVHRDIKTANILLDEDQNAYLADFGIAKNLGDPEMQNATRAGILMGSYAYISPEQIRSEPVHPQSDIYALGVLMYQVLAGKLPFQGKTPMDFFQQHINDPLPLVTAHDPRLSPVFDQVIQKATAKDFSERYSNVLDMLAELHEADQLQVERHIVSRGMGDNNLVDPTKIENPYKGLRPFQEADEDDFFGREELVQDLLARLAEEAEPSGGLQRFLVLVGPSGSGKSSVVRAGLVPAIRRGGLPGSDNWFVSDMIPGAQPFEMLEAALLRVAVNPPASLLEQLQSGPRGLVRAIERILPADKRVELLLVLDQFEEIFTLLEDESTRALFLENLVNAVLDARSRLRLVITMRADFIDRPLRYVDFGELVRRRTEFILPLTPEELESAVESPARRVGLVPQRELSTRIALDLGDQPGMLPLLQYTLTELFEARDGRRLTLKAYEGAGGVLGSLGKRAEVIFNAHDKDSQDAVRQLFLRLVTLGEGVEDTRRRVLRSEFESLELHGGVDFGDILETFGSYRLLTFDHDPDSRAPTVEVAHEALLREWPRLRGWLEESRTDLRLQRALARTAAEWDAAGQEDSFLLRGARLDQFEVWMQSTSLVLTEGERAFLEASMAERLSRQEAEAARVTHEKKLERRSQNFLRALMGVFAVAALAALLLSSFAFRQRNIAEDQARLATSRELVNAAILNLETDPELSILLGLQAFNLYHTKQAENILHRAVEASPIRLTIPDPGRVIVFSPDGTSLVATGNKDPAIRIWDSTTGELLRTLDGHTGHVNAVNFSPDGSYIASAGSDKTARLWDATTGEELFVLIAHTAPVLSVAFSRDGAYLATTSLDATVKIWEVDTAQEIRTFNSYNGLVLTASFGPDGLIATSSAEETWIWDSQTGQEILMLDRAFDLKFSPDGRFLAGRDLETVRIWDLSDPDSPEYGQVIQIIYSADSDGGSTFTYSPDGDSLITIAEDHNSINVWSVNTGKRKFPFACNPGGIALASSPNGKQVAVAGVNGIKICIVSPGQEWLTFSDYLDQVFSVSFSPDGTRLYTAARDDGIKVWDLADQTSEDYGQLIQHLDSQGDAILDAVSSPDGTLLAAARFSGIVQIYDTETWEEMMTFQGHTERVLDLAFSPDGKRLVSASRDQTAKIWDVSTGDELVNLSGHELSINNVIFSPDGNYVVTAGNDNMRIWDPDTGKELQSLDLNGTWGLSFSPDGNSLAASFQGSIIRLWDFPTLTFSTPITEPIHTFTGNSVINFMTAFNPEGDLMAAGGLGGGIKVWEVNDFQEYMTLNSHTDTVFDVEFSPDGKLLASAGFDRTVRLHLIDIEDLLKLALERLTRGFTPEECLQYLHAETCPPAPWEEQASSQP